MSTKDLRPRTPIAGFPAGMLVWLFILASLSGLVPGPAGPLPAAANEVPVIDSATNTATYSGDQQPNPINPQVDVSSTPIYTVDVNNLTSNVGSASTGTAISLTNTGASGSKSGDPGANSQALSLNYTGGNYYLYGDNYGAYVNTTGGNGAQGEEHSGGGHQTGQAGGSGGAGGTINSSGVLTGDTIGASGAIQVAGTGIGAYSTGGAGGKGGEGLGDEHSTGGDGGAGAAGGAVTVTTNGAITTSGMNSSGNPAYGIDARSGGGAGGEGGEGSGTWKGGLMSGDGGNGGQGGAGGSVTVTNNAAVTLSGDNTSNCWFGINALSTGGNGGQGGTSDGGTQDGQAGDGGGGGTAGAVTVTCNAAVNTLGAAFIAVNAASNGGNGGSGGTCNKEGTGGQGGSGGDSGQVGVTVAPGVTLNGGIWAQSIAGAGGAGGGSNGSGGDAGNGAPGGSVTVTCDGSIKIGIGASDTTIHGILAQSWGGAGGAGGTGKTAGSGGQSGVGGAVTVNLGGSIQIESLSSYGILVQSLGGAGGNSGGTTRIITHSGDAGNGADGGAVTINTGGYALGYVPGTNSSVTTSLDLSTAICAQSVGGGGGTGDSTSGVIYSIGGGAGSGGTGGTASVNNGSQVSTQGFGAHGIQAQSVGGGGGNGGGTVTGGVDLGLAIGGSGGTGGAGGQVNVITTGNSISTAGDFAHAILAESIGGGGGNGGYAITGGTGLQVSMGGSAGSGGDGGEVYVGSKDPNTGVITYCTSPISTTGFDAKGIFAQSVGGGGGAGGYSIAAGLGSVPIAIGGTGGSGGSGGEVNVYNAGAIRTSQDLSQGIFAQSVGGGGGNGGYSFAGNVTPLLSASFSFGGKTGPGGAGGAVTVYNTGTIQTGSTITHQNEITEIRGVNAHGILAQSIGGSGGHGGWAGSGSASFSLPDVPVSVSMSLSMGGAGGSGGDGGNVTVDNLAPAEGSSFISTLGDHAYGILAQSIGGGGGAGGGSVAASMSFSGSGSFSMNCPIAIGGEGGPGGAAGWVEVTNQNAIQTSGYNSLGIMAQSISGGGGDGGSSLTGALSGSAGSVNFSPQVTIGGNGGDGSAGNTVTVTNTGAITTTGVSAIGIEAQSVGGLGGNGNGAYSGNVLLGSSTGFNANVTVGGQGGKGGAGGNVTVTNGDPLNALIGTINTSGHLAPGILAQSIGGGGGNGGQSVSLNYSVKTGGAASDSDSGTSVTISPTFNIGGNGGSGGNNKDAIVTVDNYANISTVGVRSYGIQAQCIGGGGGNGGGVFTLALGPDFSNPQNTDPPATNLSGNVTVGGNGGTGGDAGQVKVDNYGAISTQGAYSYGIFAQSVGGGGGAGGSINNLAIVEALSKVINHSPSNDLNHGETISVGGKGGAAGDGNTVTVNNYGAIGTSGDCAHGIFAQSVGGGGGDGGVPTLGLTVPSGDWSDWQTWLIPSDGLSCEVGGKGGASGVGNTVTVNNYGPITTSGIGAMGIYAQSVGGGGGVASYDQSNGSSGTGTNLLPGAIAIGGQGGSGGDGGTVQVTNSGVIQTGGRGACGIYAQSIGGGGGNASVMGGPWEGIKWLQYFGLGVNLGATGGDGGKGGQVTVTGTADITTTGNNANGIFAQSVGGRGGSGSVITQQPFLWNGSFLSGASGNGGTVTVSQTGNISTSGDDSHGIVAQSIAGKDNGGNVNVTLNDPTSTASPGNIISTGLGSCGIVAQSLGAGGNGTIQISINQPSANTGLVQGGQSKTVTNPDGSTTAYQAYGVLILDGNDNLVTNYGSISTLDGVTGTAIVQQTSYGAPYRANLTIDNYGTITGSVTPEDQVASVLNQDQNDPSKSLKLPGGQSVITFNNYAGSTYNAGPAINLGGGTLNNSGVLSLGTVQSALTGNYTQTGTGTFQTTVNGNGSCGQLNVSGTAKLAGTLQVLPGTGPFKNGTSSTFLTGTTAGNFTNLILPANTSLVNFSVQYTGAGAQSSNPALAAAAAANTSQLVSHVKSYTTVAARPIDGLMGRHLDQLLAANATGGIAQVLDQFQRLAPAQFSAAFQSLHPTLYGANTDTTFSITRQYSRTLQQRLEALRAGRPEEAAPQARLAGSPLPLLAYNGANASLGQVLGQEPAAWNSGRFGVWLEGFGQWGNQAAINGFSGYNYGLAGTGAGIDYAFTRNLILGANFGYSYTDLNLSNGFGAGRINSLYGSLYGTYSTERAYVDGIISYGNHQYDNSRLINIGALQSINQSSHTGNAFALLVEGGYKFPVKQWNLQPFASLSYCNLSEGSVEESGEVANMQVKSRSNNAVVSELGVRVDRPIQTSKGTLVPMVKASWQHDFGVSQNNLPISFVGAPIGVTITNPRTSQDSAVVRAGLTFKAKGGITSSIEYVGELGGQTQNQGVMGQIRIPF